MTARPWSQRPWAPRAPGVSDQGAAHVFTDQGGTWTQIAKLTVRGTMELGTSVAISADASTIVVGSPFSNNDNGEAFVFTQSGSTYVRTQKLTATAPSRSGPRRHPRPFRGHHRALLRGSTIAPGEPNVGVTDVFTKPAGASAWTQTAQLPGGGDSVAVSSNGTIVAAGQAGINNLNGAVFVFTKSGGTFTKASEVLPPANKKLAALGAGANIGISADGAIIAFGAPTANAGAVKEAWALVPRRNRDQRHLGADQYPTPNVTRPPAMTWRRRRICRRRRQRLGDRSRCPRSRRPTGQAVVFPVS